MIVLNECVYLVKQGEIRLLLILCHVLDTMDGDLHTLFFHSHKNESGKCSLFSTSEYVRPWRDLV